MVQGFNLSGITGLFRALRRRDLLRPKLMIDSMHASIHDYTSKCLDISKLDFKAVKEKAGIQAVCFDRDNCLTAPYSSQVHPSVKSALEQCISVFGIHGAAVLSNSAGSSDDAPEYAEAQRLYQSLGIPVMRHGLKAPAFYFIAG